MWCPSASLSMWANAWLAGQAAPDDVLDALSAWAPTQSVIAHDAVAAGHIGLAWPDVDGGGAMSLLQTLRVTAGRRAQPGRAGTLTGRPETISLLLPVPGDVRGLAAGTQFEKDALTAGEAVVVTNPDEQTRAVGLVPEYDDRDDHYPGEPVALSWTVYSLRATPVLAHPDLGEAEYELRSAVRSAADALSAVGVTNPDGGIDDPRALVEQMLETSRHHRIPDHAPRRALRVLENAAHVDAIISVSADLMPIRPQSSSEARIAADALQPLAAVVRTARMAATSAVLRSAWRG